MTASPTLMVSVSGMRGHVGTDLTPELVARHAAALGSWAASQGKPLVVMGRDARTSGPMFTAAAVIAKYWGVYLGEALLAVGLPFPATIEIGGLEVSWPAFLIVAVFTALLVAGTKLTARVGAVFTIIKVAIVLFVIVVGFFFVNAANYVPFIPEPVPTEGGSGDVWRRA